MLTDEEVKYCRDMYLDGVYNDVKKLRLFTPEESDSMVEEIKDAVKSNKLSEKYLKDKSIDKIIFVKNRLINLLINE